MDVGEHLYRAGLYTESGTTEIAMSAYLYRHAAFAAARQGNTAEALLILERGKTRLLAEALRLHIPRPMGVPDDAWNAFEQAGAAVRAVQFSNTSIPGKERNLVQVYAAYIQSAQAASNLL